MRPNPCDPKPADDLFRARLSQQIDPRHPLVRLAGLIDWEGFEARFGQLYHPHVGRPGIAIRLMVGLSYLQHSFSSPTRRRSHAGSRTRTGSTFAASTTCS